jgi:TPR repeat protein
MCFENGVGVEQRDARQAIYWFRCAALQGHALARDALKRLGVDFM